MKYENIIKFEFNYSFISLCGVPVVCNADNNISSTATTIISTSPATPLAYSNTTLYSFTGGTADGVNPKSGLIKGIDGNFYGVTHHAGTNNLGTLFKVTPQGVETVLYSFGSDEITTNDGFIQGDDGNFYGTTISGGANNYGTVFKISIY